MKRKSAGMLAAGMALLAAGCGSEQSKMERGVVVDREVAAPESERELEMTEAERRAAEQAQDKKKEAQLFEESEQP